MKKTLIALSIVLIAGCSATSPFQQLVRNATAANCSSEQAMQDFVNNLPPTLLTSGQQLGIQKQVCHAVWGDVAAPKTAPGNSPAIPAK